MDTRAIFEAVGVAFEFAGVAALAIGFVVALAISLTVWVRRRSGKEAFRTLRESFGGVILLGLELLVAADLVKTVTSNPTLTDAVVLGIIVLIRTILSFSLQVEIDGVAPWRRAFVTGPEVLARAVKKAGGAGSASGAPTGAPET
ncbi:hypothetical protein ASF88_13515 [Leifsonia sp. Leaf336]|uniref:DUF1622 domain-containing protein n=1 Tax=Leifsonia sp. Leaf336 TaxID=1736341 RepID=UPI0006FCFC0E|nr:DUF1622 domain-containing protein [Leifsonia sp. Leaf336]KQR52537.1 hypothetical protein ASF88_13515 [Leifsonia sp. Leaf336]